MSVTVVTPQRELKVKIFRQHSGLLLIMADHTNLRSLYFGKSTLIISFFANVCKAADCLLQRNALTLPNISV